MSDLINLVVLTQTIKNTFLEIAYLTTFEWKHVDVTEA